MNRARNLVPTLVLTLALLGAIPSAGTRGARAQDATPPVTPAVLPATPVGDQLAWVLAQLNGGAATLTEADIKARFAPAFLVTFPAPAVLQVMNETVAMGPFAFTSFAYPPIPTGAVALVTTGAGEPAAVTITITIEAAPPHRITRLEVTEPPAPPHHPP